MYVRGRRREGRYFSPISVHVFCPPLWLSLLDHGIIVYVVLRSLCQSVPSLLPWSYVYVSLSLGDALHYDHTKRGSSFVILDRHFIV